MALALVVYGIVLLIGVLLSGPARWAVALRGRLAPAMRDHVAAVYGVVVVLLLAFLALAPTSGDRRLLGTLILSALILGGVEALRRQILRESPPAPV